MEIRFVRKQGQRDAIYVRRGDGSTASWVFPSYGDALPHDLVHLIVEVAFSVRDGFWGRVDAGVDVARINAEANRRGGADKYRGFGDDLGGLYLAEGVAGAPWSMAEVSDAELCKTLIQTYQGLGLEPPAMLTVKGVAAVRAVMQALGERWKNLLPRGTLVFEVVPGDPLASLATVANPA